MPKLQTTSETRVIYDPRSGAIRSWFDTTAAPITQPPFAPAEVAQQLLVDNAELFRWQSDLPDLKPLDVVEGENAFSVRFTQQFKEIPVDSSEVVVNLYTDGRAYAIYNSYHYDIPQELDPKNIKIGGGQAREIVAGLLRNYEGAEIREAELIVYQYQPSENRPPKTGGRTLAENEKFMVAANARLFENEQPGDSPKPGEYYLAWDMIATTRNPSHSWRILVDAMTGRLLNVIDLFQYATGNGQVFDPNPIVTSGNAGLSSATPLATLNGQRSAVGLDRLNAADAAGNLHLDGSYARMEEIESPVFAEPVSAAGNFGFGSNDRDFLATMCYFHIDRVQNYIQTVLGMTNVANFSIAIDPQGQSGADNSRYSPTGKNLAFGEGGIPDAADAYVILHEYGHAIQDNQKPGFGANFSGGTSEGFGDFLAAVYYDDKHTNPAATRGATFPWDANPTNAFWPGRRYDVAWLFDGTEFASGGGYERAQLWSAAMFELYRKLGGDSGYIGVKRAARDLAIRLHLMANFNVASSGTTAAMMGNEILAADGALGGWRYANGLHKKVIYDTFRRRHLAGYPDRAVDVYVNDGREGGYGSASGNDLFTENLWDENYWDTQDIWVRTSPYANAAAQAAGGPADHVEPPVGSPAYLYVRVKNKGTSAAGSGPVTVKAFHCLPSMGLVWPVGWTPMTTPSINVANILPGAGSGVVVGPFDWTPATVGHECVLVIVECANDRAVTELLVPADLVAHVDLVPFDNNIAQRNLAPTSPKGRMARGFYVNNPYDQAHTVTLHYESTLPDGWRWQTNVEGNQVRLGPRERQWVELYIDQAGGAEVTQFEKPHTLTITGTIEERVIGGMTFYVAPPSAFGEPEEPEHHYPGTTVSPADLFCLNIPWNECDVEGEIELKMRFRKK